MCVIIWQNVVGYNGGMEDCVFCKIVRGEVPADKVYEDDEMMVFPDIKPSADTHLLFVSKKHGEEFDTIDLSKLARMLDKVRTKIKEMGMPYRVAMNGSGANLVSNHMHIHLLGNVSSEAKLA